MGVVHEPVEDAVGQRGIADLMLKLRGLARVEWLFMFTCAAYNLLRIPKLREQSA
jgi:hypothetical protein